LQFLNGVKPQYELTYNDVFLVPGYNTINSRFDVDLTTPDNIGTTIPLIVANMNAVAGKRMAEVVTRRGGLVVLPQDIPMPILKSTIDYIKSRHLTYETPLTLSPDNTIAEAQNIINKRSHGLIVIVDEQNHPVGIFKETDAVNHDKFTPLGAVSNKEVIAVPSDLPPEKMFDILLAHHVNVAPVVKNKKLVGMISQMGAIRSKLYTPAVDKNNQLLVAVAVGVNGDVVAKVGAILDLGTDIIVLDTADGYQKKMIEAIKLVRRQYTKPVIAAGNIVTAEGTEALLNAGADIIKVGVGPGAMCTTRMMTGVGRPQFSAVLECSNVARKLGKHVWADGGIRYPRDVALALAAGASNVFFGSMWAGTYESVSDTFIDKDGRLYKESYGMASKRAVKDRSANVSVYDQRMKEFFEEGISTSKQYIDSERPGAEDIIDHMISGVRSSMSYVGAKNLTEFYQKAIVGIQSAAGYQEGKPLYSSWL
jgi:IMP dehydrogenase